MENRRRYKRFPMRQHVICIVDSRTSRGVGWNLSQGGMLVEVTDLKPEDSVQLSFRLPVSGVAVDAVGAVVWGGEKLHGIEFVNMGAQSKWSIRHYISQQMER